MKKGFIADWISRSEQTILQRLVQAVHGDAVAVLGPAKEALGEPEHLLLGQPRHGFLPNARTTLLTATQFDECDDLDRSVRSPAPSSPTFHRP